MKEWIALLVVFALLFSFVGCSSEADATTTQEETPQSSSTEETTLPPETDGTQEEERPKYVSEWMQENFLCDEDPEAAGRTICTNHEYDEEYSLEGATNEWLGECELNWRKTRPDAEGMFADATVTIRIESLDGSSYMILHDGENANFVYVSDQDCYVQLLIFMKDLDELVSGYSESVRRELIMQDNEFYMEDASPEELALTFIEHCMEIDEQLNRKPDELLTHDYEVREYEGKELIYVEWTMICYGMPRYADFSENDDGTYTVYMKTYLEKTEDGFWYNMGFSAINF